MDVRTCARVFMDRSHSYHRFPQSLTHDWGYDWLSHVWQVFCEAVGITQRLTTTQYPEPNASEWANQEMLKYLRKFTCYALKDWFELLSMV